MNCILRGKGIESGEWHHGTGATDFLNIYSYIERSGTWIWSNYGWVEVIPDSLGVYSCIKDKNENMIFEGDILQDPHSKDDSWERALVYWDTDLARFGLKFYSIAGGEGYTGAEQHIHRYIKNGYYIIGNLTDNPELIG